MRAIPYLDLNARHCSQCGQCLVQFDADCCCAADPQQHNCKPCGVRLAGKVAVADYVCMCGGRLYVVEATERENLWGHKDSLVKKFLNTKSVVLAQLAQYKVHGLLADVFIIVSRTAKLSKQAREYFQHSHINVRLVAPSNKICA